MVCYYMFSIKGILNFSLVVATYVKYNFIFCA